LTHRFSRWRNCRHRWRSFSWRSRRFRCRRSSRCSRRSRSSTNTNNTSSRWRRRSRSDSNSRIWGLRYSAAVVIMQPDVQRGLRHHTRGELGVRLPHNKRGWGLRSSGRSGRWLEVAHQNSSPQGVQSPRLGGANYRRSDSSSRRFGGFGIQPLTFVRWHKNHDRRPVCRSSTWPEAQSHDPVPFLLWCICCGLLYQEHTAQPAVFG
jgi:hypothetical protein